MTWDDFYDQVRIDLPASESAVVDMKLREASIEFFSETCAHLVYITPMNVVADQADYALTSPVAETDVVQVRGAWFNNQKLFPATEDDLLQLTEYWRDDEAETASHYLQPDPDTLRLYPIPTQNITNGLRVQIAICPALDATGVEDAMGRKYFFALSEGCKALMMEMKGKPWTSPEGAAASRAKFEAAKSEASIESLRNFTRARLQARMSRVW